MINLTLLTMCLLQPLVTQVTEFEESGTEEAHSKARALLHEAAQDPRLRADFNDPSTSFALAGMLFRADEKVAAHTLYLEIAQRYPDSSCAGEALFWAARAITDANEGQSLLARVHVEYPQCRYAAEAYFDCFADEDYLLGKEPAVKHLEAMPQLFPQSPYLINAYYLIGLDSKRSHRSEDGRRVRPPDLNNAIQAFKDASAAYERLCKAGSIPEDQIAYFTDLRDRAELERGLANEAIALQSEGVKKEIYLQYAIAIFKDLSSKLEEAGRAGSNEHQEVQYELAKSYCAAGNDSAVESVVLGMLERYQAAKVTRGYYLSRLWSLRATIAARREQYQPALDHLVKAEEAAKGKLLSTDEKLELWIQRSEYHRKLGELDQAMSVLSQVINDQTVSALRLKAMFLRAEIYEQQGRPELASKQLTAIANQSGEWAQKAREKLEKSYGHQ